MEMESAKADYLSAKSAMDNAQMDLFTQIESYKGMVKGLPASHQIKILDKNSRFPRLLEWCNFWKKKTTWYRNGSFVFGNIKRAERMCVLPAYQKGKKHGTKKGREASAEFMFQGRPDSCPGFEGKFLVHQTPQGILKGKIVEVEAYMGKQDAAAHSCKVRPPRTEVQYGVGGFAYIYLIYGMYYCMNIVSNREEIPEVVLLRALEPLEGP